MNYKIPYIKKDPLKDGELYKKMWDNNPDILKYSEKQISEMIVSCNEYMADVICSTREGIALPLSMGVMFAGTYGKRENAVDKVTSKEVGKEVVYPNHDTDGYGATIYYTTEVTKTRFALGKFWGFHPSALMKQTVAAQYRANWKMYAHVPDSRKAWEVFTKGRKREFARNSANKDIENYDEFDF